MIGGKCYARAAITHEGLLRACVSEIWPNDARKYVQYSVKMRTVTLAWCFIFVLLTFATQPEEKQHHHDEITQEEEDHQRGGSAFPVETKVFNAFPDVNITAFVIFEEERISRLAYGHFIIARPMLEIQADFVIQFRKIPKEGIYVLISSLGMLSFTHCTIHSLCYRGDWGLY